MSFNEQKHHEYYSTSVMTINELIENIQEMQHSIGHIKILVITTSLIILFWYINNHLEKSKKSHHIQKDPADEQDESADEQKEPANEPVGLLADRCRKIVENVIPNKLREIEKQIEKDFLECARKRAEYNFESCIDEFQLNFYNNNNDINIVDFIKCQGFNNVSMTKKNGRIYILAE